MNDPFVGSLTFIRIYSGTLTKGTYLNSVKDKKEKVGRMLEMHANERKDVDEAFAGDIIALAGMKDTTTGDTLCSERQPIVLERMEFPEPVIELSVEPKTKADQERMGIALNRLSAEDPSFRVSPDEYLGDVIGDMNSRRGQIQGTDSRGNAQVVESLVPLANMFGYVNQLRSFTQGRANYSMFFSHYDEVPANVATELKEKLA